MGMRVIQNLGLDLEEEYIHSTQIFIDVCAFFFGFNCTSGPDSRVPRIQYSTVQGR